VPVSAKRTDERHAPSPGSADSFFFARRSPIASPSAKARRTASSGAKLIGRESRRRSRNAAGRLQPNRLAVSLARIKHQACSGRLERRGGMNAPEAAQEKEELELASAALAEAEAELRAFAARPILPFEIKELLNTAVESCQSVLAISSRNLGRAIVDAGFIKRRNVRVSILLSQAPGADATAAELERLRRRYLKLELSSKKRGGFHHLVCDDAFAVICNRPLLGNQDKVCTFHHVVGILLQEPTLVRAFIGRIDPRPHGGSLPAAQAR
jgi:hypothetical protein